MVTGETATAQPSASPDRALPPVTELAVASMILVIVGGIYLAAHLPVIPPLAPAVATLVGAAAILVADVVLLSRARDFAWHTFFLVARWALLAYAVIAGLLAYVFITDGTRGSVLVVLVLTLLIYAVDIPLILAFSVARYQSPER
jgi:hypothetical protein